MKSFFKMLFIWLPRIFCILFAAFISIFALDVFSENYTPLQIIEGLLIHLIPTCIIIAVLILSWKWQWIGAVSFTALAFAYIIMTHWKQHWSAYLLISGSLLLLGILFLIGWLFRSKLQNTEKSKIIT